MSETYKKPEPDTVKIFQCGCYHRDHSLVVNLYRWGPEDLELIVDTQLTQYQGFFTRCWAAFKYIIKYSSSGSNWESTCLSVDSCKELKSLLETYINEIESGKQDLH